MKPYKHICFCNRRFELTLNEGFYKLFDAQSNEVIAIFCEAFVSERFSTLKELKSYILKYYGNGKNAKIA